VINKRTQGYQISHWLISMNRNFQNALVYQSYRTVMNFSTLSGVT